jgi:hypothetical protein
VSDDQNQAPDVLEKEMRKPGSLLSSMLFSSKNLSSKLLPILLPLTVCYFVVLMSVWRHAYKNAFSIKCAANLQVWSLRVNWKMASSGVFFFFFVAQKFSESYNFATTLVCCSLFTSV